MQRLGQLVFAGLLASAIVSCAVSAQADTWWNKGVSYHHPAIARIVNQATCPFIGLENTPDTLGNTIALSYRLNPEVKLQWIQDTEIPQLPAHNCDMFLYYPSAQLSQDLQRTYAGQIEWVTAGEGLIYLQRIGTK